MSPFKQCLDEPVLDSVDGDVVAEDRVDNLIQLVRVVDRCVKGELLQERILQFCSIFEFVLNLALGSLGLDIVLPEVSLLLHAGPSCFLLVDLDK